MTELETKSDGTTKWGTTYGKHKRQQKANKAWTIGKYIV
jgi:hypothetical protein